jgi:hypothetical protein
MKIIFLALIATLLLSSQSDAKSFEEDTKDKRFLGSVISGITSVINTVSTGINNVIINPIVDVVNVIGDGINTGINVIGDGINTVINTLGGINVNDVWSTVVDVVWNPVQNTVVDIYDQAVGGISTAADAVGNFITIITGGVGSGTVPGQEDPDFCSYRCKAVNNAGTEFFYDQPNGCPSKGYSQLPYNFNMCCDSHNYCLNTKCCTTECQQLKDNCDSDYKRCLRGVCSGLSNFDEQDKCINLANLMAGQASSGKCNPGENRNRKLCIC